MGGTIESRPERLRLRIDRGPNWLFVKASVQELKACNTNLAEELWSTCVRHLTYRLVLELDDVKGVTQQMHEQFEVLRDRLTAVDGALRVAAANELSRQTLSGTHLAYGSKNRQARQAGASS